MNILIINAFGSSPNGKQKFNSFLNLIKKKNKKVSENSGIDNFEASVDINNQPRFSLASFERVTVEPGETKMVILKLGDRAFDTVLEDGRRVKLSGKYRLFAGGQQPDERSEVLTGKKCLTVDVEI